MTAEMLAVVFIAHHLEETKSGVLDYLVDNQIDSLLGIRVLGVLSFFNL